MTTSVALDSWILALDGLVAAGSGVLTTMPTPMPMPMPWFAPCPRIFDHLQQLW
jgi:hypothetical protein